MDIFLTKRMDSLQEAFIHPPEPCEACFIMDAHTLYCVFWTVEQKQPPTAMIELSSIELTLRPPNKKWDQKL